MREIAGNIWDYYDKGNWIVITTNGFVKKNGEAVMGRGVAKQAKDRFPKLPYEIGEKLIKYGNWVFYFSQYRLLTFPVKHTWWEKADFKLIEFSCHDLVGMVDSRKIEEIYMVRPGCGNGGLDWKDVKPVLEKYLDNRFVIVELLK